MLKWHNSAGDLYCLQYKSRWFFRTSPEATRIFWDTFCPCVHLLPLEQNNGFSFTCIFQFLYKFCVIDWNVKLTSHSKWIWEMHFLGFQSLRKEFRPVLLLYNMTQTFLYSCNALKTICISKYKIEFCLARKNFLSSWVSHLF